MAKAVEAGADPQTTRIAEVNVLPVQVTEFAACFVFFLIDCFVVCH